MNKGIPRIHNSDDQADPTIGQEYGATSQAAIETVRKSPVYLFGKSQPILDPLLQVYPRVFLKDGSCHWIVSVTEYPDQPLVVFIANDLFSGIWYSFVVDRSEIARVEQLPEAIVEQLPPKEKPFGFAAGTYVDKTTENKNVSQTNG